VRAAALALLALVAGCRRDVVLSRYGTMAGVSRDDGGFVLKRAYPHQGVDFRVDRNGGPALAAADGVVDSIDFDPRAGFDVRIRHAGFGTWTRYIHLESVAVHAGQEVRRGQVLGDVGVFLYSAGVRHVHLELCRSALCYAPGPMGTTTDPMPFMAGCFDPARHYPGLHLVLTYPVRC
jgi:murein DD-endopeptidase MepM/ murein hydrolase activator NlpD